MPDFGKEGIRTTTESNVSFATSLTKGGVADSSFSLQAPTLRTEALINATAADCAAVRDACKILQELSREEQQEKTLYMVIWLQGGRRALPVILCLAPGAHLDDNHGWRRMRRCGPIGENGVQQDPRSVEWEHSLHTKGAEMH